jgi:hypothetical protein
MIKTGNGRAGRAGTENTGGRGEERNKTMKI